VLFAFAKQRRGRLADVIIPFPTGQAFTASSAAAAAAAVRLTFSTIATTAAAAAAAVQACHARHGLCPHVRHDLFGRPKGRHFGGGGDFERGEANAVARAVGGTAGSATASPVE